MEGKIVINLRSEHKDVTIITNDGSASDLLRSLCDSMVGLTYSQATVHDAVLDYADEIERSLGDE